MYGPFRYPQMYVLLLLLVNVSWALRLLSTNVWCEKSTLFLMTWLYKSSALELVGTNYIEIYI